MSAAWMMLSMTVVKANRRANIGWGGWDLLPWFAAAMVSATLALVIDTQAWVRWFQHPGQPDLELTRAGALLLRTMLGLSAVALAGVPLILRSCQPRQDVAMPALSRSRKRLWGIVAVLVIALAARAMRLTESLWYDEIASWMTYVGGTNTIGAVIGHFFDPINHVLHTLLNHLAVTWIDPSPATLEIAFRLPALAFSLLSVMAMHALARAAASERAAMIAAALTAILPVSVLEGVEARGYSMMIFFAAAMTWALLEALGRKRPWIWGLYSVLCALGIWSHLMTVYVPIGHALWLAWRAIRCREWRVAFCGFAALGLGAILTVTLYAAMIPEMLAARGMFAATTPDQPRIFSAEGWHALLQLGGSWSWWAACPGLILLVMGAARVVRGFKDGAEPCAAKAVVLSLLGLPLMLLTVILGGTWIYARFTLFAFPGVILLMALGLDELWMWKRTAGVMACLLIGGLAVTDLQLRPPKQPLRETADFVRSRSESDDRIVVVGLAHEVMRAYAGDLNLRYSHKHGADLEQQLATNHPRWVIIEYPNRVPPQMYQVLQSQGFNHVARFDGWADWTNGDILVYQRN